jgi:serine/threonine protein kinase
MGILGYELLVGHPPFERESRSETYEQIMYRRPQYPAWLSEQSCSFISAALTKVCTMGDPAGRVVPESGKWWLAKSSCRMFIRWRCSRLRILLDA